MSTQFATRAALIAFACVTIRGVIEFADFQLTISSALKVAAVFFGISLIVGELARRTAEEVAIQEFQEMTAPRQSTDSPNS